MLYLHKHIMLCCAVHNIIQTFFFVKNFSRCYKNNRKSVGFYRNCSCFVCVYVLEGGVCLYFDLFQPNSFIENIFHGNLYV